MIADDRGAWGSLEFYARCERERKPWESLPEAAARLARQDMIAACGGNMSAAARALGMLQQSVANAEARHRRRCVDYEQLGNRRGGRRDERLKPRALERGPVTAARMAASAAPRRERHHLRALELAAVQE